MKSRAAVLLIVTLITGKVHPSELGRMFFTPEQREGMDEARRKNIKGETTVGAEQTAAPMPQNVSVNGVIRRSDGKNTIWLNNRAVNEKQAGGIRAAVGKSDGRVRLNVPESGRSVDLKVGQTVEITSGTVEESYVRHRAASNPGAKSAEGRETSGVDATRTPTVPQREAAKSDSAMQKRTPRAAEREPVDDVGRDGTSGSK